MLLSALWAVTFVVVVLVERRWGLGALWGAKVEEAVVRLARRHRNRIAVFAFAVGVGSAPRWWAVALIGVGVGLWRSQPVEKDPVGDELRAELAVFSAWMLRHFKDPN